VARADFDLLAHAAKTVVSELGTLYESARRTLHQPSGSRTQPFFPQALELSLRESLVHLGRIKWKGTRGDR